MNTIKLLKQYLELERSFETCKSTVEDLFASIIGNYASITDIRINSDNVSISYNQWEDYEFVKIPLEFLDGRDLSVYVIYKGQVCTEREKMEGEEKEARDSRTAAKDARRQKYLDLQKEFK